MIGWLPVSVVVLAGCVAGLIVVVLAFLRRGLARVCLLPAVLTLALLPSTVAVTLASQPLRGAFSALSTGLASNPTASLLAACRQGQLALLIAMILLAATLSVFLLLLFISLWTPPRPSVVPASPRRLTILALLALLPFPIVASSVNYCRQTLDLAAITVASDASDPEDQRAAADYEILDRSGSAGIRVVTARIGRGLIIGTFGGPLLFVVLVALSAASVFIAWPAGSSRLVTGVGMALVVAVIAWTMVLSWRIGSDLRFIQRHAASSSAIDTA